MKHHPLQRKRTNLLALEARFMFDGAVVDAVFSAESSAESSAEPLTESVALSAEVEAAPAAQLLVPGNVGLNSRREIAFIDQNIYQWNTLLEGIPSGVEVALIDAREDGLTQMVNYLKGYHDVDAIHWLIHGQMGVAMLGNLNLDSSTVAERSDDFRKIGSVMSPEGDFLLYSCDLTANEAGFQLIGEISRISGVDVAASEDATGTALYGGNWVLETQLGSIETESFAITEYEGLLALPGAHSNTTSGQVFIGGNYIEVGIQTSGKFGASPAPSGFLGRQAGLNAGIGMVGDADGFGNGADLRVDYFMPGTPEEGFYAGYKISGTATTGKNFASTITNTTSGNSLGAQIASTLGGNLEVTQDVSFNVDDKFFKNIVTLRNIGSVNLDNVRFMRSFDPDNTVDLSGSYSTINKIERTITAGDGIAVVSATSSSGDNYYNLAGNKQAKILYYSSDSRARGSYATSGLAPSGIYDANIYDSARAKDATATVDAYISMAVDVGTLAPGESTTYTYYTSLDNRDIATILGEISAADNKTLTALNEDPISNPGQTVSVIFDAAVAVTSIDNTHGAWQYSSDGSAWSDFSGTTGSVVTIASSARLLSTSYFIRFVPDANYNGSSTFSYRVWSGNGFTAGDTTDASSGGGEFSANTANANISINAVNDTPVLSGVLQTLGYVENSVPVAVDSVMVLSDVDANHFNTGFIKAEMTSNGAIEDQLSVLNQGTGAGQIGVSGSLVSYGGVTIGTIDGTLNGVNNTALKITLNSNASIAATQALIRSIAYNNISDHPSIASRTLTYTINDGGNSGGGGALETTRTATINITRTNDAPINDVRPSFAGGRRVDCTLRQDGVLSADPSLWHDLDLSDPQTTFRYQWQVADDDMGTNLIDLPGATDIDFQIGADQIGKFVRVKVYGSDGIVETEAFSCYKQVSNQDPVGHGPLLNQEITESMPLSYSFPANVFSDLDIEDTIYYSATLSNGAPLPGWLRFDPITRTFSGTPSGQDAGTIIVRVIASDHGQHNATLDFTITVLNLPLSVFPENADVPPVGGVVSGPLNTEFIDLDISGRTREFLNDPSSVLNVSTITQSNFESFVLPETSSVSILSGDLTRSEGFVIVVRPDLNRKVSLSLGNPIDDEFIQPDTRIKLLLPTNIFFHTQPDAVISLEATLLDGKPLPDWLKFDAKKGEFYGIVPRGVDGDIEIKVKAKDNFGQQVFTKFKIRVKAKNNNMVEFSGRKSLSSQLTVR